jgi:16S rRNA (guanine966-N2)-methyltransferase
LRLVAGKFKGAKLQAPDGLMTRPTADRVRESLFNILAHGDPALVGARVADIFAGSGALGLEALSRGADHVCFIEFQATALATISANVRKLGCENEVSILRADAVKPPRAAQPCQFLLLDPPYRSGLAAFALPALDLQGWIADDARIIVEIAASEDFFSPLPRFDIIDERRYGAAKLIFLAKAGIPSE